MVLPIIALVAGVGALGYWGSADHAKNMEAQVASGAFAAVDGVSTHDVKTEVSGRDIIVTGLAHSQAERDAILASLKDVDGRRVIRDELQILPVAQDYTLTASKSEDGLTVSGVVPTLSALETIKGNYTAPDLNLASGEPDMAFGQTASASIAALNKLDEGELAISGKTVQLRGLAPDNATLASLGDVELPPGYTLETDVTVPLQFVENYTFNLTKDASGAISGNGFAPDEATAAAIQAATGGNVTVALADGAPDLDWAALIGAGHGALDGMTEGEVSIVGNMMDVTGKSALGEGEAITAMLAEDMPVGAQLSTTISEPEPVLPPKTALSVFVDANEDITVYGDAPADLSPDALRNALGLPNAKVDINGVDTDAAPALAELEAIRDWLPEFETALFEISGNGITLEGETKSDVDATLLQSIMAEDERFANLTVSRTSRAYEDGFKRLDLINGEMMEHISGYWIPVASFDVTTETCTSNLNGLVERQRVTYLANDATLSPKARRAVNALAGLFRRCLVDDNFVVQIHGHTDSVGDDAYNLALSKDRAASVVNALTARGITAELMVSEGFGESQPIATNDTAEGRSMNRRTDISLVRR